MSTLPDQPETIELPPDGSGKLSPVTSEKPRPFWSVVIPIYERTQYLPESLGSVLKQAGDESDMEIIVHDDCSVADTRPAVEAIGGKRARYIRNHRHRGLWDNCNDALAKTSGRWIHVLHEDDYVRPGFYATLRASLEKLPDQFGLACCQYTNLHEAQGSTWSPPPFRQGAGELTGFLDRLVVQNPLNVPAVVYRRSVFETVGTFRSDMSFTGDWEFYIRASTRFAWWYQPENLACWRVHAANHTWELQKQGRTAEDIRKTIKLMEGYLPADVKQRMLPVSRQVHGRNFLVQAWQLLQAGQNDNALIFLRHCLRIGGPTAESTEFAQVLQHPGTAAMRAELAESWRKVSSEAG